jgi:predicted small secreted protein
MEKKKFSSLAKLGIGAALMLSATFGVVSTLIYKDQKHLSTKKVLKMIKAHFLKEGPIEVAYIEERQEKFNCFAINYEVYRGGVIRKEDENYVLYEFLADIDTGAVISINRSEVDLTKEENK